MAEDSPDLSALASVYWTLDESMTLDFKDRRYQSSFALAERLLTHADLPYLIRARALMILATSETMDAVELAQEAVRILDQDVRELAKEAACRFPQAQLDMAEAILAICKRQGRSDDGETDREEIDVDTLELPTLQDHEPTSGPGRQDISDPRRRGNTEAVASLTYGLSNVSLETTTSIDTAPMGSSDQAIDRGKKRRKKTLMLDDLSSSDAAQRLTDREFTHPSLFLSPGSSRDGTPVPTGPSREGMLLTPASVVDDGSRRPKKKQREDM